MYSRDQAKARANRLREILKKYGHEVSNAHGLEVISQLNGYKDWNTCAAAMDRKMRLEPIPDGWVASGDQRDYYDFGVDPSESKGKAKSVVIRYRDDAPQMASGFATLMQSFDAANYRGKRVQLSSSLKCTDCDGAVTIWMRADSYTERAIAFDNLEHNGVATEKGPITGTTDWNERVVVLDIPEETQKLSLGLYVRGKGAGYCSGFHLKEVSLDTLLTTVATTKQQIDKTGPVNLDFGQ